jgi:hypothetical protein
MQQRLWPLRRVSELVIDQGFAPAHLQRDTAVVDAQEAGKRRCQ